MDAPQWTGDPGPEHDPAGGDKAVPYVCTACPWTGKGGTAALEHHVITSHDVRGRYWPARWPNAVFTGSAKRRTWRKI
jgi:hypothetical protein